VFFYLSFIYFQEGGLGVLILFAKKIIWIPEYK